MVGGQGPIVDEELTARAGKRVTAVVRLPESRPSDDVVQTLQNTAAQAQQAVTTFVRDREGVEIENEFWITNAVVLTVDTATTSLEEIARIQGVRRIHPNFEMEAHRDGDRSGSGARATPDGEDDPVAQDHGDYTYGLQQIGVPSVWDQLGTKGAGARVAVLDTGIDADHPDIDLATNGWAEFDSNGNQIDSQPYDDNGHGTHTSGTVSGGAASGTHIGVAPDVELYHGGVLTPDGGSFSAVIAGIQWAVEQNADVINMSLGPTSGHDYLTDLIDPLQNAKAAGTLPVSSCGNSSEGTSGTPANVYDAGLAVGASNSSEGIASFSSGELVDTDQDWGSAAPTDWPAEYVVPDIAAPGVDVKSSVPGGGYDSTYSGTSMASPHVAGVACLMVAASGGDVTPGQIRTALESTAWKPSDWDESQAAAVIDGKDSRYGLGIVDALAAVQQAALDTGVTGTVESDGAAVEGATVELDGSSAMTDSSGAFEIPAEPGTYDLTVTAPGIVETTVSVTVQDSGSLTDVGTITVDSTLDVFVESEQADGIVGGDSVSVTLDAYNLEALQIDLTGTYTESDATLAVDGQTVAFGETVAFSNYSGTVPVTVSTTADIGGSVGLNHVATGAGEQTTVSTGPTIVSTEVFDVGVVSDGTSYGSEIVGTLDQELPGYYQPVATTTDSVIQNPESYDTVVAQKLNSDTVPMFVSTVESADLGVVYLDQWGSDADAISQYAGQSSNVRSTGENFSEGGPYYRPTDEHPLFDGVATDSDVLLHEDSYSDYAYFEAGDALDVVASLATDSGVPGDGLAVHEPTRAVFAATLGRSQYVGDPDFTAAADTILANAVKRFNGIDPRITASATLDGSEVQLSVDATKVEGITIDNVWTDWTVSPTSHAEAFEDSVSSAGACGWNWASKTDTVSATMTATVPDRYVGGTYALTVRGTAQQHEPATTTVTVSLD